MSIKNIASKLVDNIATDTAGKLLVYVVKNILKKDSFECAIEQSLDELRKEKYNDFMVLEDIYNKRKEIFNKINIISDETVFNTILAKNEVEHETSSRIYRKLNERFNKIIIDAAKEKPDVFRYYFVQELNKLSFDQKFYWQEIINKIEKISDDLVKIVDPIKNLIQVSHLHSIEFELKKGIENEGKFFRQEGPLWVDFQNGYVVKRKEVEQIIDFIDGGSFHFLLVGDAASGKSVISRNVGYELANRFDVFYFDSKEFGTHTVDAIFQDILKLKNGSFVIIEDAHSYSEYCDDLLKDIRANNIDIIILFTARSTYNLNKKLHYLDSCRKFMLEGFDFIDAIIKKYTVKNKLTLPSAKEMKYLKDLSKGSLWVLAYLLMAWKPNYQIDMNLVYKKVHDDLLALDNKYDINDSQSLILALAPFYKYEISIEKPFLTGELTFQEETIRKLIEAGEIKESNGFISLNHSVLAEIYINTSKNYPDLINLLLYKLRMYDDNFHSEKEYVVNMFRYYLGRYKPLNYDEIFTRLSQEEEVIPEIFRDKKTCLSINNLLNKEQNIRKIGRCLIGISEASNKVGELLAQKLELISLISKIEDEDDIEYIGWCICGISEASALIGETLAEKLELDDLISKIKDENDIEKIGYFISEIWSVSNEVSRSILEKLDLKDVLLKIEEETDIEKIGNFVNNISFGDELFGLEFVDIVKSKLEKEQDIEKIGRCISEISQSNRKFGVELVEIVKSKLEKEKNIGKIGDCINDILHSNKEIGLNFIDIFKSKLDREQDIEKIGNCISSISEPNFDVINTIVQKLELKSLILKIEKEQDIEKIGRFVSEISRTSKELGLKLVDIVESKLENESDIEKIEYCIDYIFYGSVNICKTIVQNLELKSLKLKMEKEPDIKKVEGCISVISRASKEIGMKFIDVFISKLDKEQDIENIGVCIDNISSINSEFGIKLVDIFKLKLEREQDIETIRICGNYFSEESDAGKIFVKIIEDELQHRN